MNPLYELDDSGGIWHHTLKVKFIKDLILAAQSLKDKQN